MTIDEAIKLLEQIDEAEPTTSLNYWREAIQLGIEALKRIQVWRAGAIIPIDYPLQSERNNA